MEDATTIWKDKTVDEMLMSIDDIREHCFSKINSLPIITDRRILRQKSTPATMEESKAIVKTIKLALPGAWTEGCGLAAIQVGIARRVAWTKLEGGKSITLINPEVLELSEDKTIEWEGCLSIPNKHFALMRSSTIKVILNGHTGRARTFTGWDARAILHEIDHMDGILNIDKAIPPSRLKKAGKKNNPEADKERVAKAKAKRKQQKQSRKKNRRK